MSAALRNGAKPFAHVDKGDLKRDMRGPCTQHTRYPFVLTHRAVADETALLPSDAGGVTRAAPVKRRAYEKVGDEHSTHTRGGAEFDTQTLTVAEVYGTEKNTNARTTS